MKEVDSTAIRNYALAQLERLSQQLQLADLSPAELTRIQAYQLLVSVDISRHIETIAKTGNVDALLLEALQRVKQAEVHIETLEGTLQIADDLKLLILTRGSIIDELLTRLSRNERTLADYSKRLSALEERLRIVEGQVRERG